MRYCKQCGAQISDGAKFCSSCGARTNNETDAAVRYRQEYSSVSPYNDMQSQKQNGLSIAGFVVSLAGIFVMPFISGIVGVILSVMGVKRSKEMRGTADGLAIAGIIIGAVNILYGVLMIWLMVAVWSELMPMYFDPSIIDV